MADNGKVRLVRCPKCENLLPELPDYSVYQCGGCGAVLRANIQPAAAAAAQNPHDEKVQDVSEKLGMFESDDASEAKVNPNDGFLMPNGNVADQNAKGYPAANLVTESGGGGCSNTKGIVHQNGHDLDLFEKQTDGQSGGGFSSRVEQVMEKRNAPNPNVRFSVSKYPTDEGPSSSSNLHSREVLFQKLDNAVRDTRVQCLENDRAELLRKLDELKDQLSRSSCNVVAAAAESNEKVPPPVIRRTLSSDTYGGGPSTWCPPTNSSTRTSTQLFGHDLNGPYLNRCPEMLLYKDRQDIPRGSYPSSMHNPSSLLPPPYQLQPSHHYFPGHDKFMNSSDAFLPTLQQSSCGCLHCYEKHRELFPSSTFCKKENSRVLYHHHPENASSFGSHGVHHNPRSVFHPFSYQEQPHRYIRRWSGLNCSERAADFHHLASRKSSLTTRGHRHHRPIAGGAPIVACTNCFELLQLPKKVMLLPGNQQKLRCGACSNIIYFSVIDRKIIFPVLLEASDRLNRSCANFSSDDFDNSGYEFHAMAMDRKAVQPSASRTLSLTNSQETESLPASSPSISHDEINSPEDGFGAALTKEAAASPPPLPGSPLQRHFDYSTANTTQRFIKGNRSSRSDKEKVITASKTATVLRQNSLNEASLATELEVSYNDYSNNDNGGSQDSSRDDDQARHQSQKGGESFLSNFIKKSFKDLSRNNPSAGNGKTSVSVNGYPISARLVKKAEKLAGKIQPGNYWYDSRAGFWGIMGGPCLGIIPPYIEEFNYPMPEKCGGGDSGVFVNGRELHKQDLELLATRGLPTDRDRSYIIEISGRVLDEDTGEELDCLGRLAPTVEKVKHGFGMKAPKGVA